MGRDDIQECFSDYLSGLRDCQQLPKEPADLYEPFEAGYLFGEQEARAECDARVVELVEAARHSEAMLALLCFRGSIRWGSLGLPDENEVRHSIGRLRRLVYPPALAATTRGQEVT